MDRDYSKEEVLDIIERIAVEKGIPRDDFLRFAYIETGGRFDELASRGPRGAKGLFQFVPETARQYGLAGLEFDPNRNTNAAAQLYLDNIRSIERGNVQGGHPYLSGSLEPSGLDMYMAHQQGAAGYRSIQNAIETGDFSRGDTRSHLLNNVSTRDFRAVTGMEYDDFVESSDQAMAETFVSYWDQKFNRIKIPEKGVEPRISMRSHGDSLRSVQTVLSDGGSQSDGAINSVLHLGQSGEAIRDLQHSLNVLTYRDVHDHVVSEDGDFGRRTREAVEAFQRENGLSVDGIAGPKTLGLINKHLLALGGFAEPKCVETFISSTLADPGIAGHLLYKQAYDQIQAQGARQFGLANDSEVRNAAGTLAFEAKVSGLRRIDHVVANQDTSGLVAVEGAISDPGQKRIYVDRVQAAAQPLERSSEQLQQESNRQTQQQTETQVQSQQLEPSRAALMH